MPPSEDERSLVDKKLMAINSNNIEDLRLLNEPWTNNFDDGIRTFFCFLNGWITVDIKPFVLQNEKLIETLFLTSYLEAASIIVSNQRSDGNNKIIWPTNNKMAARIQFLAVSKDEILVCDGQGGGLR